MKYVFILGGIAVVIVAASLYFLLDVPNTYNQDVVAEKSAELAQESTQAKQDESSPTKGLGTMLDIQNLGKNLECQVSYDMGADGITRGTMFIADEQIRADFMMNTAELGDFTSSMIQSDGFLYSWSDIQGSSYGMKTAVEEAVDPEEDTSTGLVPIDDEINYDCKPWPNVDRSVFTPPSDVQFKDFDEMFQPNMEYGTIYEQES